MRNYILAMTKRAPRVLIAFLLAALLLLAAGPGFRSRRQFDEHSAKHGREFGNISQLEYLQRAPALRDASPIAIEKARATYASEIRFRT